MADRRKPVNVADWTLWHLHRPIRILATVGEHHIPRLLVVTMGGVGIICGVFFMLMGDAGPFTAAWSFLLHSAIPSVWASFFLITGGGLVTAGIIEHTRAGWLCFIEALLFFWLALASLDSIDHWGTRVICFVSITFGWVCLLGMLSTLAVRSRHRGAK